MVLLLSAINVCSCILIVKCVVQCDREADHDEEISSSCGKVS